MVSFTASVSLRWAANSKDSGFWIGDCIWFWWYWPGWRKSSWNSSENEATRHSETAFMSHHGALRELKKEPDYWRGSEQSAKAYSYQVDSLQSYTIFVSQPQQENEKSVLADLTYYQQRHCAQEIGWKKTCYCYVPIRVPVFIHHSRRQNHVQRLYNQSKINICYCKAAKQ